MASIESPSTVAKDAPVTPPAIDRVGYLYLVGTVVLNGAAFHFIKVGVRYVPSSTALLVYTLCAIGSILAAGWISRFLNLGGAFASVTPRTVARQIRALWTSLGPATLVGMLGGWLGIVTISRHTPELVAFLSNMTLVFLVVGGVLRGDRLAVREFAYIVMVIAGVFLFSWRGQSLALAAIGIMAVSCIFTAAKQIMIKEAIIDGKLWEVMAAQQTLMAFWVLLLALATGTLVVPPAEAMPWLILPGVIQNFLGMGLLYAGYRKVGVARGAPIYAMRPLTVLAIGIVIGTAQPGLQQIVGGGLVLAGSALLTRHRPRKVDPPQQM